LMPRIARFETPKSAAISPSVHGEGGWLETALRRYHVKLTTGATPQSAAWS
jgi:hypothetical protein